MVLARQHKLECYTKVCWIIILLKKKVVLTSEPTLGPVGQLIRSIMQGRLVTCETPEQDDRLLAYLFAADRHDHLYNSINGIINQVNKGYTVISTRYYLSSLAYHVSDNVDNSFVSMLNKNFPLPDFTFYLDCQVNIAIERLKQRDHLEKYENFEKLVVVRENYKNALKAYDGNISILNGEKPTQILHEEIFNTIKLVER